MGCGASQIPPWEATVTDGWPSMALARVPLRGGKYTLTCGEPAMLVARVEPYKNKNGYVSVKSHHPYEVTFQLPGDLGAKLVYKSEKKMRALVCNDAMAYVRTAGKPREVGPSDTTWSLAAPASAMAVVQPDCTHAVATAAPSSRPEPGVPQELPRTISVVNTGGRVLVWRGKRPTGAAEAAARAPTDLLARLQSAASGVDNPDGSVRFRLELDESLAGRLRVHRGELPLFLAIALEAFWSQGACCHAFAELGVRATSVDSGGADVRPNSSVVADAFAGRAKLLQ